MNDDKAEAIAKILLGALLMGASIPAGLYLVTLTWLSYGILGFVLAGVAGAVAFIGPYGIATGVSEYREVTAS